MQLITDDKLILHLAIARITFLSFEEKKRLFNNLDSSNDIALLSIKDISKIVGRNLKTSCWNARENLHLAELSNYFCKLLKVKILLYSDSEYPVLLRQIYNPPYLLFCRGNTNLLNQRCISVVGTRQLTFNGRQATLDFCRQASLNGWNVVSGLANGTDGFAHKGVLNAYFDCLEKGQSEDVLKKLGKNIAILPSSIDTILPVNHKTLASEILRCGGCLVSEYEPRMTFAKWHFVARNRIIAGISAATVVVEAPVGSGALITADFAVEMDRDLYFHQSAVSELAKKVDQVVRDRLVQNAKIKKVSNYKINNTVEKFIDMGAPVIKDFTDFCYTLVKDTLV